MIPTISPPAAYGLGAAACVAVGLAFSFDFELIGRITGSEPLVFASLLVAIAMGRFPPLTWPLPALLALTAVWLAAQFASDLINESAFDNMARGMARSGMTAVLLVGFHALLANRMSNLYALYFSLAIGSLLGAVFNPSVFFDDYVWKFGYGNGATMLMVGFGAVLWRLERRFATLAVCAVAGALNFYLGYRSLAGAAFMTALLLGVSMLLGRNPTQSARWHAWAAFLVIIVGGLSVIELYARAAQSGALGDVEQERYLGQVDERGVLLSGRAEFPVALEAIMDSPLFGHGSWAVNEYYSTLFWSGGGFRVDDIPVDAVDLIPTHSHLMGAWVEGGVFAALLWLYVLTLLVRAVAVLARNLSLAEPIIVFTIVNFGWALLFSPYGLGSRVTSCFAVAVIAYVLHANAAWRQPPAEQ